MRRPFLLAIASLLAAGVCVTWLTVWPGAFFPTLATLDAPGEVTTTAPDTGRYAIVHQGPGHPQIRNRGALDASAGLAVFVNGTPAELSRLSKAQYGTGADRKRLVNTFHAEQGDEIRVVIPGVDPPATFHVARSHMVAGSITIQVTIFGGLGAVALVGLAFRPRPRPALPSGHDPAAGPPAASAV